MRFNRHQRYEFQDTPRKRAAFFSKQRREREALPLFSDQIAEEQKRRPGIDEVMQQRAIGFAKWEQEFRDKRAAGWRKTRRKLASYGENVRHVIRQLWSECPYPADPSYLLTMLHSIDVGRINIDHPPWRFTEEDMAAPKAKFADYLANHKPPQQQGAAP